MVIHHSGRDKNVHILKHQIEKEHPHPQYENFKIISSGFCNVITLRRDIHQKPCVLTISDLP